MNINSGDSSIRDQETGIRIKHPEKGVTAKSPIHINGEAKGNWYFEAEFTVKLIQDKKTISETIVKTQGDWMTEDFVPFSANLKFSENESGPAFLMFKNSNSSGKTALDKTYHFPVVLVE